MKEYAHLLHALADGKTIQERNDNGTWQDRGAIYAMAAVSAEMMHRNDPARFRVKPDTIEINGHEVPAPLREAPAPGATVFCVMLDWRTYYTETVWDNDQTDRTRLAHGLLHSSPEAAEAHARALLSFTEKAQ